MAELRSRSGVVGGTKLALASMTCGLSAVLAVATLACGRVPPAERTGPEPAATKQSPDLKPNSDGRVTVTRPNGEPVAGAHVRTAPRFRALRPGEELFSMTDAKGVVVVPEALWASGVVVTVMTDVGEAARTYPAADTRSAALVLERIPGELVEVQGTVTDGKGAVEGARVNFHWAGRWPVATALTGADGSFRCMVPRGPLRMAVGKIGWRPSHGVVEQYEKDRRVAVTLNEARLVDLRFENEAGDFLASGNAGIGYDSVASPPSSTYSRQDSFYFEGGRSSKLMEELPNFNVSAWAATATLYGEARLKPGAYELTVVARPAGTVCGRIVAQDGRVLPKVKAEATLLSPGGGGLRRVALDGSARDGTFCLQGLSAGRWKFAFEGGEYVAPVEEVVVDVVAGQTARLDVEVIADYRVSGTTSPGSMSVRLTDDCPGCGPDSEHREGNDLPDPVLVDPLTGDFFFEDVPLGTWGFSVDGKDVRIVRVDARVDDLAL